MKAKKEKLTSKWSVKNPLYITKKDKRYSKHVKMLKECGFSDTETWSLYSVIAEFALPRLKRFKEITICHPANLKDEHEWSGILDKIIFAFEWVGIDDNCDEEYEKMSDEERKKNWDRYLEGMKLFAEYFRDLWW